MAVEAKHLDLFHPQIVVNRELATGGVVVEGKGNVFGDPSSIRAAAPSARTMAVGMDTVVPFYSTSIAGGALSVKAPAMKSDSGLTSVAGSRKRPREAVNALLSLPGAFQNQSAINRCGNFTFLGEDISFQIQQQQLEFDRFISLHTEKVRKEIEERRKSYAWRIAAAAEKNILRRLKAKEQEIEKIGKLNHALEERVHSLCVENHIWRDLAHTNEATANALRSNLEQVIAAQAQDQHFRNQADASDAASSCCDSNHKEIDRTTSADGGNGRRMCRSCWSQVSCVLLLPCRHLCLCTICGSTLHTCPICNATKTASVHVNLST